jgi:hypothetical protein
MNNNIKESSIINNNNIENIKRLIMIKNSSNYIDIIQSDCLSAITDYDHFPYTRNFRGVYNITTPVIIEREAGFRPRNDQCYNN